MIKKCIINLSAFRTDLSIETLVGHYFSKYNALLNESVYFISVSFGIFFLEYNQRYAYLIKKFHFVVDSEYFLQIYVNTYISVIIKLSYVTISKQFSVPYMLIQ